MRIKIVQKIIDKLRGKHSPDNRRTLKENTVQIAPKIKKRVSLDIEGKNNTVIIKSSLIASHGKIVIEIYGDNNEIIIEEGTFVRGRLRLILGNKGKNFKKIRDSKFFMGENTSVESMDYITFNSNTKCLIGKNCMISIDVTLYNTDAHPVFDLGTKKLINKIEGIEIGEHCWLGAKTTVLKNSKLPTDSNFG